MILQNELVCNDPSFLIERLPEQVPPKGASLRCSVNDFNSPRVSDERSWSTKGKPFGRPCNDGCCAITLNEDVVPRHQSITFCRRCDGAGRASSGVKGH